MDIKTITLIGYLGVLCCTAAYILISLNLLKSDSWFYQALNSIGGISLVLSALFNHDTPNIIANGLWALIGIVSLCRLFFFNTFGKHSH